MKAFIEKHQPALSLHGHVHEAPTVTGRYQAKLGKTLAVNPGQTGEGLCYALVHVDGDGAVRVERGHQA